MMSISDALGRYGYLMTADQSKSMESMYSAYNNGLLADGHDFTEYYDPSRKPDPGNINTNFVGTIIALAGNRSYQRVELDEDTEIETETKTRKNPSTKIRKISNLIFKIKKRKTKIIF